MERLSGSKGDVIFKLYFIALITVLLFVNEAMPVYIPPWEGRLNAKVEKRREEKRKRRSENIPCYLY